MDDHPAARSADAAAFTVLDSEIRLAILDALYDRTVGPGPAGNEATYSAIKSDVGITDSGRFSYHLDKLVGQFVAKSDGGYRISESGRRVVQLRRSGVISGDQSVDWTPIEKACYLCGADLEASYDGSYIVGRCQECSGLVEHDLVADGVVTALGYPPSGVKGIDIATAFERAYFRSDQRARTMAGGFCQRCGNAVTASLGSGPEASSADAPGWEEYIRHHGMVMYSCDHCGRSRIGHPLQTKADREPMASYFADRGLEPGWRRFGEVMSWPVFARPNGLAYEAPDGTHFLVDRDLEVERA